MGRHLVHKRAFVGGRAAQWCNAHADAVAGTLTTRAEKVTCPRCREIAEGPRQPSLSVYNRA